MQDCCRCDAVGSCVGNRWRTAADSSWIYCFRFKKPVVMKRSKAILFCNTILQFAKLYYSLSWTCLVATVDCLLN
ncbi:hypothetical protein NQZ68_017806 [Dissostichus eleginoides]|nr:hypothetical protein NQZ68_017806 [Dissostichus eleginoides]